MRPGQWFKLYAMACKGVPPDRIFGGNVIGRIEKALFDLR